MAFRVAHLHEAFTDDITRTKATGLPRGLIERVVLHPGDGGAEIEFVGGIARWWSLPGPKAETPPGRGRRYLTSSVVR